MDGYVDKHLNTYKYVSLEEEIDFEVSLFQFEKGEYISNHDYPDMTGVINVVSGNTLLKNYTIEEQLSDPKIHLKTGMETYTDKYLIKE
jgi:quercetin dioxygenase-like cupin family protein